MVSEYARVAETSEFSDLARCHDIRVSLYFAHSTGTFRAKDDPYDTGTLPIPW